MVAGCSAWRVNRSMAGPGTWRAATSSVVAGIAIGMITLLVLGAVAEVAAAIAFEHSGFVW
jgi:ABC-type lipoprotein release transport system permease subunit